ncbi:RagB/SusD family nutrient uptake outer membrane protein [Gemmatirosa kalamazoonensis]|nr:RagB/SusD family nutrient uptake outer membrane protein [Gemmatirosa kalamazoonensis]
MRRAATSTLLLLVPAVGALSCTDLTVTPKDALTPSNAFRSDAEVLAGVASVYAQLRQTVENYYNISEISSGEMIVPTRGSDWYDNGVWVEEYQQGWTANSALGIGDINGVWNAMFSGIARANLMIDVINTAGGASKDTTLAELRTLRAWYYYVLQDFFGGVPLVTSTEVKQYPRSSRDEIFKFIESELKASAANLPTKWPDAFSGRVTKGAANAILASLYLNAQVYDGNVTAAGLTKGTARWQDAISAANAVINSGVYSLATDWKSNFSTDNHNSPENIFYVQHTAQPGLGMSLQMRSLHYNQTGVNGGPWNGFSTTAEVYRRWDAADPRRSMWLVGPQRSFDTGQPTTDRQGNPLIFTDTIGNITAANENEGVRPYKFPVLSSAPSGDAFPNNYPIYRLAEMYLIRAEAQNELGQTAAAIADVNIVRRRVGLAALNTGMSQADARTAIFAERQFELAAEGKYRQDAIRAGVYTAARQFKTAKEPYKILMPIPATQIQTNPLLTQNPGY